MKRAVARGLFVATMTMVLGSVGALPAMAGDKDNSEAEVSLSVDCHSVEASSSKDVSNVKVYFTDGTMEEIHVNAPSYSQTFDKEIDYATAKSGTTEIRDDAGDCGGGGTTGGGGGGGTTGGGGGGGTTGGGGGGGTTGGGGGDVVSGADATTGTDDTGTGTTELCPAGTDNAGQPMSDLAECDDADVIGRANAPRAKICPSGPFKGMPFMNPSDCGTGQDVVLARQVVAQLEGQVDGRAQAGALPMTGPSTVLALLLVGGSLIGAGAGALRRSRG